MADAIDQAIAFLEAERKRIDQALVALMLVRQSRRSTSSDENMSPTLLSAGSKNEPAIDTVLRVTRGGLTTREIIEKADELGKTLNQNSVRWTLHHGVLDKKYVKRKDGRLNRYWLAESK